MNLPFKLPYRSVPWLHRERDLPLTLPWPRGHGHSTVIFKARSFKRKIHFNSKVYEQIRLRSVKIHLDSTQVNWTRFYVTFLMRRTRLYHKNINILFFEKFNFLMVTLVTSKASQNSFPKSFTKFKSYNLNKLFHNKSSVLIQLSNEF